MNADDTPLSAASLPFDFHFFGRSYPTVYINPNGALHVGGPVPPCGCCFAGGPLPSDPLRKHCTLGTSWSSSILLSTGDLNPSADPTSDIRVGAVDRQRWVVRFISVPAYMSRIPDSGGFKFTFGAVLHREGRVQIALQSAKDPVLIPSSGAQLLPAYLRPTWLIGIKPQPGVEALTPSNVVAAHDSIGRLWGNDISYGSYPRTTELSATPSSAKMIEFCPAPTELCVGGTWNTAGGGVRLHGNSVFGCDDAVVTYKCAWYVWGSQASYADATLTEATLNSTQKSQITCPLPNNSPVSGRRMVLNVTYWSQSLATDSFPASATDVGFVAMGQVIVLDVYADGTAMAVLGSCNSTATSNNCVPDCDGMCGGRKALDAPQTQCCLPEDMDCMGVCHGGSRAGMNRNGLYSVCCKNTSAYPNPVDCQGYCYGGARIDACGYCTGGLTGVGAVYPSAQGKCPAQPDPLAVLSAKCNFKGIQVMEGGDCLCLPQRGGRYCEHEAAQPCCLVNFHCCLSH